MELDLSKHCTTERLQPNIFGNLKNYIKPSKKKFKRNPTYEKNLFIVATDINVNCWAIEKAIVLSYKQYSKIKPQEILFHFQLHLFFI